MRLLPVAIGFIGTVVGCTVPATDSAISDELSRPYSITQVQAEYGLPDAISDESGDQKRFYIPEARPRWEWPASAPRTLYYLKLNRQFTFVLGRLVESGPLDPISREMVVGVQRFRESHE